MKLNQKSVRDGIQNVLFPVAQINITQGNNGQYSHQGVNALDLAGGGRFSVYAPFDVICKSVGTAEYGNPVVWESLQKVRFANGTISYATILLIHDNDLSGIYKGVTYAQGMQIANAGNAGNCTGIHTHFEIAPCKFTTALVKNGYGVWHLPNSMSADQACFVNDTQIINGNGMSWKSV